MSCIFRLALHQVVVIVGLSLPPCHMPPGHLAVLFDFLRYPSWSTVHPGVLPMQYLKD
jgi:hypothetical protein